MMNRISRQSPLRVSGSGGARCLCSQSILIFQVVSLIVASGAIFLGCAHSRPGSTSDAIALKWNVQAAESLSRLSGRILMQPFKPGEGVAADQRMRQASLIMVKSFTEHMNQGHNTLEAVGNEAAADVDFFLTGYITQDESVKGAISRWRKKPQVFAVQGTLWDLQRNRSLMSFSAMASSQTIHDPLVLADRIARDLAVYLRDLDKDQP